MVFPAPYFSLPGCLLAKNSMAMPSLPWTSSHVSLLVSSCSACVLFWWVFATSIDTNSLVAFAEWNNHCGSNRSSTRASKNAGRGSCTLYKFTQKTDRASNQQPWWFANSGKFSDCPVTKYTLFMFFMKFLLPFISSAGANWEVERWNHRKEITYTYARAADGAITGNYRRPNN